MIEEKVKKETKKKVSKKKVSKKSDKQKIEDVKTVVKETVRKYHKVEDMDSTDGVKVPKSSTQIVIGNNALIKISIFTPGYEPMAIEVVIPDIIHMLTLNVRKPKDIVPHIVSGLKIAFGQRVVIK